MQILSDDLWQKREDELNLIQVRLKEIQIGDHYIYRSANSITKGATYDAEIVKITQCLIVVDLLLADDRSMMQSYRTAIQISELGRTERLYRRVK